MDNVAQTLLHLARPTLGFALFAFAVAVGSCVAVGACITIAKQRLSFAKNEAETA
jgi:hypothetical protein